MKENPRSCWRTPKWLFDLLDKEFEFSMDGAADEHNHLCEIYCSRENDAFNDNWDGEIVFLNPPYSGARYGERPLLDWVVLAHNQSQLSATVVMLLPTDTGTEWFKYAAQHAVEIRLLTPRIEFDAPHGSDVNVSGNRGASCVLVFGQQNGYVRPAPIVLWDVWWHRESAKRGDAA